MIRIEGVSKRFRSAGGEEISALLNIRLEVPANTFVSIVGPSGCGKSTLLSIIAGLITPDEGQVIIGGKPLTGPRDNVGIVFQNPLLLPWRTVLQNVLLPVELRKWPRGQYQSMAMDLIRMVGLEGFENYLPHELSGGMQQRAAIARALILDPDILLLDEPFGPLDAITREQMNLELAKIWELSRKVVVLVTHNISEAVFLADIVVVMSPRPGRIIEVVDVDIPRPRDIRVMDSQIFMMTVSKVRRALERGLDSFIPKH